MTTPMSLVRRFFGSSASESDTEHLHVEYQQEVDLLYARIGPAQAAENIEVEPGVYVRVLPNARRVVGIEVLDCAARFRRKPSSIDGKFAQRLIEQYTPRALAQLA